MLNEEDESLQANVYGWAVSMVIRDAVWFHHGTHLGCLRLARSINSIVVAFGNIFLQVFLLLGVWRLLCRPQRHKIQDAYNLYEYLMYPNHTVINNDGHYRGIPGYRQDERFQLMKEADASQVCEIPLAHPAYLTAIILVWTLTCQVEIRGIIEKLFQLLARTPTVRSLDMVLKGVDGGEDTHAAKIQGLTMPLKIFIAAFIQIPRLLANIVLLWLGCRWLTATIGLGDVLLNGVALEFILNLDELLYNVCIAHRNRIATEKLYIAPFRRLNKATFCTFFDAQIWGIASLIWAVGYVFYFQQVLPDYQWDVHDICNTQHFYT